MTDDLVKRLSIANAYRAPDFKKPFALPINLEAAARIQALEADLAKAVVALDEAIYLLAPTEKDMERQAGVYRIVTTLAELKGGNDD